MNLVARRGIYNFENLDLDDLSADKAYEFLFSWAPLKLVGVTGSPGNPVAAYSSTAVATKRAGFTPCPLFCYAGSLATHRICQASVICPANPTTKASVRTQGTLNV